MTSPIAGTAAGTIGEHARPGAIAVAEPLYMRLPVPYTVKLVQPCCRAAAMLLLTLLAAPPLQAQGVREYVVELVLFEHLSAPAPGSGSVWAPASKPAMRLGTQSAASAGFEPLQAPRGLDDDVQAMTSSGRYRVLEHLQWVQPGLPKKEALRIDIQIGPAVRLFVPDGDPGTGDFLPAALAPRPDRPREITTATLSGTLELYLGRFLHLNSQLVYTDPDAGRSYRLSESRKMRSKELHYIDNPRFGILTRILRAEDVLPDAQAPSDPEGALPVDDDIAPEGIGN